MSGEMGAEFDFLGGPKKNEVKRVSFIIGTKDALLNIFVYNSQLRQPTWPIQRAEAVYHGIKCRSWD